MRLSPLPMKELSTDGVKFDEWAVLDPMMLDVVDQLLHSIRPTLETRSKTRTPFSVVVVHRLFCHS